MEKITSQSSIPLGQALELHTLERNGEFHAIRSLHSTTFRTESHTNQLRISIPQLRISQFTSPITSTPSPPSICIIEHLDFLLETILNGLLLFTIFICNCFDFHNVNLAKKHLVIVRLGGFMPQANCLVWQLSPLEPKPFTKSKNYQ